MEFTKVGGDWGQGVRTGSRLGQGQREGIQSVGLGPGAQHT